MRKHRRNPDPVTVHSLQSSEHLCGHEETPEKTKPRNSPQSTVIWASMWTGGNTRETQIQEQSSIYSHLSVYVDRREHRRNPDPGTVRSLQSSERLCVDTREQQRNPNPGTVLNLQSSERLCVDTREQQRNPDPGTVLNLQSSEHLCGHKETPEKTKPRNSPQSTVIWASVCRQEGTPEKPRPRNSPISTVVWASMWTGGNTGENQTQEQSSIYSHLSVYVDRREHQRTQIQEQSTVCSHLSICVWTRGNTRETQTQEQSSIYSHLSIYVDRREHQRNPDPGTVHSLQSSERLCGQEETPEKPRSRNSPQSAVIWASVCGHEGTPEKPRPRNSPQSAVMSVKGKTEMLTEGEGDWGRERGLWLWSWPVLLWTTLQASGNTRGLEGGHGSGWSAQVLSLPALAFHPSPATAS